MEGITMKKYFLSAAMIFSAASPAWAAELTPGNLVGRYKVEARAGFQKVYANFRVVNTTEFEVQRTYPNGNVDEVCNGTFNLLSSVKWDEEFLMMAAKKSFKGSFTCPSDRSKEVSFNIDFGTTTTEDLARGTNVTVTSSIAPGMRLNAYVKKQ
ncbi:hypothetical protein predicted by Glimmer/Critica [Bdellovibrio bacteriovorus HD100]|uniref:Uncharacterized protein n=2 Tax=Bdellovibrio bacteriovorus TaxID=959 RepID=Q6MJ66_BDEBA|nr:hypothetical protein EP01_10680 [Bdellovibrio bacteriovorus]CAE80695.1 hypothetical protein predicted by Glimmer/Critica [Bdellovibrio bacteriovorus HD100]